jgi:hypothetical protein
LFAQGGGTWPCSKFNEDRQTTEFEGLYFDWAQGFMSAVNVSTANNDGKYVDLNALTIGEQKSAIRTFCKMHPEKTYTMAIWHLMEQMPIMEYHKADADNGADDSTTDNRLLAEQQKRKRDDSF